MVKKQNNITLNMDLGKMTGAGKNPKSDNRDKSLFETLYLGDDYEPPKREEDYSDELEKIPQFGDHTLLIPPFFAVPSKGGKWRLANPLTQMRNLANRKKELSVNIKRANVPEPELEMEEPDEIPTLDQFSAKDQAKLKAYFEAVKQGKEKEYLTKNKPRGFPAVLYKNAKKAGLKETKEKVYTNNKVKAPKKPKAPKALTSEAKRSKESIKNKIGTIPELTEVTDIKKYVKDLIFELNQQDEKLTRKRLTEIGRIKDYLRDYVRAKELPQYLFNALSKALSSNYSTGGKLPSVPPTPPPPPPTTAVVPPNIAPPPETTEERDRRMRQEGNARLRKKLVRGGELPKGLNPLEIIPKGLKAVKDKVVDIAEKVVKGRDGYSPSVAAIIEKFADQEVKSIELHRRVLPAVYTGLLNVLTLGEFNKRIKDQPKDKLFHISMWVKLANGKTVLVEKNEVINMKVNPKKEKEEEVQMAGAVPAGLKFGEMLEKTQKQMGGKYFTYSARDNNCGNYIEAVLKANGMNTEATHAFIGQDAKAILKGYPRIAKLLNVITDTAGRANVLMEGGGMEESDCDCGSESECECDDKEMNGEGMGQSNELLAALSVPERNIYRILKNRSSTLARRFLILSPQHRGFVTDFINGRRDNIRDQSIGMSMLFNRIVTEAEIRHDNEYGPTPPATPPPEEPEMESQVEGGMIGRGFHVATMTNRFHRIPQSESQIKPHLQGSGLGPSASAIAQADRDYLFTPTDRAFLIREPTYEDQMDFFYALTNFRINNIGNRGAGRVEITNRLRRERDALRQDLENWGVFKAPTGPPPPVIPVPIPDNVPVTEARVPLLTTEGREFRGFRTARVRPVVSNEPLTGQYVSTNQPSLLDRFSRSTPIASVAPEPPARGLGLKKPKFAKGSQEAKDYMKMLRDKRRKK